MSRVGKKPILIPENVEVKIEGQRVTVKGPRGELFREVQPEIKIEAKGNQIFVSPLASGPVDEATASSPPFAKARVLDKKTKALWGLTRVLIFNMIKGVVEGYEKKLQIEGLGFKSVLEDGKLLLYVGFSHPVKIDAPPGIKFSVEKNIIIISGIDKELVGQVAASIRKVKPPEPYKGKGIRYLGETIRRKLGKKAVTTGK